MSTKILWTREVLDNVMSGRLPFSYVVGEAIELKDEVVKLDLAEARKEWDDVVGCFLVWLTGIIGVSFPLLPFLGKGAADRWVSRLSVWQHIFDLHGVEFHRQYLTGGGNYCKRSKIKKAFSSAGYTDQIRWELLDFIDFEEE